MKTVNASIFLLIFAFVLTTQAYSVTCDIKAFDFYTRAKKKGWSFSCGKTYYSDPTLRTDFFPLPPGDIGCVGKLGIIGTRSRVYLKAAPPGLPALSGGWRITGLTAELKGLSSELRQAIYPDSFGLWFNIASGIIITPYTMLLKKIQVEKNNGSCSNFNSEAF